MLHPFGNYFITDGARKSLLGGSTHLRTRFFKFDGVKKACWAATLHPFRNYFITDGARKSLLGGITHLRTRFFKFDGVKEAC